MRSFWGQILAGKDHITRWMLLIWTFKVGPPGPRGRRSSFGTLFATLGPSLGPKATPVASPESPCNFLDFFRFFCMSLPRIEGRSVETLAARCYCLVRDALKGTNLRGQTPICGFLRLPAVFCGFLRFSAVSCENQRFPAKICVSQMLCFLGKGENLQKSAKICENLRLGSVCPLRFVPLSAP